MEVCSRAAVEERDEGTVLVGKKTDRLNLPATHMAENFFCRRVRGDVAQVDGSARARHQTRSNAQGSGRQAVERLVVQRVVAKSGGLRTLVHLGVHLRRRHHASIHGRRHGGVLLLLVLVVLLLLALRLLGEAGEALEARRSEGRRRLRLEGAANQQVRRKKRGVVHVESSARGLLGLGGHVRHTASVDGRNVCAVTVRVARNRGLVGGESAVREAQVVTGHTQSRKGLGWPVELGLARGSL